MMQSMNIHRVHLLNIHDQYLYVMNIHDEQSWILIMDESLFLFQATFAYTVHV